MVALRFLVMVGLSGGNGLRCSPGFGGDSLHDRKQIGCPNRGQEEGGNADDDADLMPARLVVRMPVV
jgi:hypothetical protein